MANKKCIFHVPNYIDVNRKSGSNIRPLKMINAFKEIGYDVDVVMGYAKERKEQIKKIKQNIKNGIKYDFLYSESSTMPTLLTEKNHLPLHPMLDFSFFKYCKKNGIKIGLFYRDIHWKFDVYRKNVSFIKRIVSIPLYKYDLLKYRKYLNVLYIPTKEMKKYLPKKNVICKKYNIDILPPGCDNKNITFNEKEKNNILNIFYVGGISEHIYNFEKLFAVVCKMKNVRLTVCCREPEWNNIKSKYIKYINENIHIVHASGQELEKYYKEADVCSLIFNRYEYMNIAMPVKLFEYIQNKKPIIATKNTAAGKFVEENHIGWTTNYEINDIEKMLKMIRDNKSEIYEIQKKFNSIIDENTWNARVRKVVKDLK